MNEMHQLLQRQWAMHFGDTSPSPEWKPFLQAIDSAYRDAELSSAARERNAQEMLQANAEMRAVLRAFPGLVFRINRDGEILESKADTEESLGTSVRDVVGRRITDVLHSGGGGDPIGNAIRRAFDSRGVADAEYTIRRGDKDVYHEARVVSVSDDQLLVIVRDVTRDRRAEWFRREQIEIFEMIASGTPLKDQLERLARLLEAQVSDGRCAVLIANRAGSRLDVVAAPGMPQEYFNALAGGIPIAEGMGSCGTAAYRRDMVVVEDVATDPLCRPDRATMESLGFCACCSMPIMAHNERSVGTLTLYFKTHRTPTGSDIHILSLGSHIAAVAVQRKRAEDDLFNSRQMLRTVLDTIPLRVFWKDRDSVFAGCNQALADARNYRDPGEIVGKTDRDHVSPEIAERYRADDREVMETNRPKLNYEEPQVTARDSELRWLRTSKVPLHDKNGEVIGVLGTYEDITEAKQREQALRNAEAKYRNIVENAVEGIFRSDLNGLVTDANPAFARMLGFATPDELLHETGETRPMRFVDTARHQEFVAELRQNSVVHRFEARIFCRDRRVMWISLSVRVVTGSDGTPRLCEGFAEDITDRKQLEEQFRQAQKMEAFGQLAGGIAHDFNNLLTVIRVSVSMLNDAGFELGERMSAVDETLKAVDRATSLTRQLLTFSRRHPLNSVPLNLNDVVSGMMSMLRRVIGEHITLETHYAHENANIHADQGTMEQAVMNLAVNARDAMPAGGKIAIQTTVVSITSADAPPGSSRRPGEYVCLSVSDTGTGIAPEHLPHIFEPFFTTKPVGRGTGLGLATVYGIIEQHRGWIEVESFVGVGSTFRIFLPRITEPSANAPTASAPNQGARGRETILLVEDESEVRTLMTTMLERFGYRVISAKSGVAALEIWRTRQKEIDLVVTDVVMPDGVSGSQLAERLRADRPDLKVIFCSGYSDEALGPNSPLRNNPYFIEKPFDIRVMLERIRTYLDS